jgi:hypothetical protein
VQELPGIPLTLLVSQVLALFSGTPPKIARMVVIMIGRKRDLQAW